jgi:2'-5' RNA ligase
MQCSPNGGVRVNSFALVSYIPDPLGHALDRLRSELVEGCNARAHVTLLPPRPLAVSPQVASDRILNALQGFTPFSVEITRVAVFDVSSVVHLEIGRGADKLREIHDLLNKDVLASRETHLYEPHITLAQDLTRLQVAGVRELAERRWAEITAPKCFEVEKLTFVQNTEHNQWLDLAWFPLHEHAGTRR